MISGIFSNTSSQKIILINIYYIAGDINSRMNECKSRAALRRLKGLLNIYGDVDRYSLQQTVVGDVSSPLSSHCLGRILKAQTFENPRYPFQ